MSDSAAARLCSECGMCCNGVMFHSVRLQPGDSPKELASLGLKLRHKKRQYSLMQPCPVHRESQCSIYADRPTRCRVFECQQLQGLAAGERTEREAWEKICEAKELVAQVRELFLKVGSKNQKRSFIARYESILSQPVDEVSDPEAAELRRQLVNAYQALEVLLDKNFRIRPNS